VGDGSPGFAEPPRSGLNSPRASGGRGPCFRKEMIQRRGFRLSALFPPPKTKKTGSRIKGTKAKKKQSEATRKKAYKADGGGIHLTDPRILPLSVNNSNFKTQLSLLWGGSTPNTGQRGWISRKKTLFESSHFDNLGRKKKKTEWGKQTNGFQRLASSTDKDCRSKAFVFVRRSKKDG